jgi:hypothetical protein
MRLEEMKCSVCGSFVPAFRWYDNVGLVEYRYECPCGHIKRAVQKRAAPKLFYLTPISSCPSG